MIVYYLDGIVFKRVIANVHRQVIFTYLQMLVFVGRYLVTVRPLSGSLVCLAIRATCFRLTFLVCSVMTVELFMIVEKLVAALVPWVV